MPSVSSRKGLLVSSFEEVIGKDSNYTFQNKSRFVIGSAKVSIASKTNELVPCEAPQMQSLKGGVVRKRDKAGKSIDYSDLTTGN